MANYQLANDTNVSIAIHVADAAGDIVAALPTDVFTVVSSDMTKMMAVVGVMPSGPLKDNPAVILTPIMKSASGIMVTVSDSAGLNSAVMMVDIVADLTPKSIVLDVVDAIIAPQPVPAT